MYVQSIVEGTFMQTSMHTISGRCLSSIVLRIVTIFLQISAHDWLLISAQGTNEVYGNVWVHLGTIVCFLKWKRCILKMILARRHNCKCNWPHDRVFRCEQYNRYASSVTLTFKNWAIHGINFISFLLFDSVDSIYKLCRWLDLNSEPLVFELWSNRSTNRATKAAPYYINVEKVNDKAYCWQMAKPSCFYLPISR